MLQSDGFHMLSTLGSTPVPTRELMKFDKPISIFSSETSRVEWTGIK